jgi:hypothetical protein
MIELKRNIKVLEKSCKILGYNNIEELKKAIDYSKSEKDEK